MVVMDQGRIAEMGTHDELLDLRAVLQPVHDAIPDAARSRRLSADRWAVANGGSVIDATAWLPEASVTVPTELLRRVHVSSATAKRGNGCTGMPHSTSRNASLHRAGGDIGRIVGVDRCASQTARVRSLTTPANSVAQSSLLRWPDGP